MTAEELAQKAWEAVKEPADPLFAENHDKARLIFTAQDVLNGAGDATPFAAACREALAEQEAEWAKQEAHVALVAELNAEPAPATTAPKTRKKKE